MTLYYCHVCERNVHAIDTIKATLLTATIAERKEDPAHSSQPHHELECEDCHQSYIEELDPTQPAPTVAATVPATPTAAHPTPAPTASQPLPSTTPPSATDPATATAQPSVTAQITAGSVSNGFVSGVFGPAFPVPRPLFAPHMPFMQQFPFPFPFPGVQPVAQPGVMNFNTSNNSIGPQVPFPFPFPFPGMIQPNNFHPHPNPQPTLASHPANYALNHHHFNHLLTAFLHPLPPPGQQPRGVDRHTWVALPRRRVGGVGEGGERKEGCVVCQSEMEGGEEVVLLPGCGHSFHVGCIEPWFEQRDMCPTCRRQVTAEDVSGVQSATTNSDSGAELSSNGSSAGGSAGSESQATGNGDG